MMLSPLQNVVVIPGFPVFFRVTQPVKLPGSAAFPPTSAHNRPLMKTIKPTAHSLTRQLVLFLAALLVFSSAYALDWGVGGAGGNGTWDTTTSNWWDGGSNVVWPNNATATGVFGAASGTVTIAGGGVGGNILTFNTGGYVIQGGPLSLIGNNTVLTANAPTTINSTLVINGTANAIAQFKGTSALTFGGTAAMDMTDGTNRFVNVNNTGPTSFAGGLALSYTISASSSSRTVYFGGVGSVANINGITTTDAGGPIALNAFNFAANMIGTTTISGTSSLGTNNANSQLRVYAASNVVITGVKVGTNRMNFSPITGGRLELDLAAGDNRWGDQTIGTDLNMRGGIMEVVGSNAVARSQIFSSLSTSGRGSGTIVVNPNGGPGTTIFLGGGAWNAGTGGSVLIDVSAANAFAKVRDGSTAALLGSAAGGQTATSGVTQTILIKDSTGIGYATHGASGAGLTPDVVRYTGAATLQSDSTGANTNFKIESASVTLDPGVPTFRTLSIDTASGGGVLDLGGNLLSSNSILFTGANDYTISNGAMTGVQSTTAVIYQYGTGLLTFSGTLNSGASLTKAGPGTLVMTGNNGSSAGTIVVSGGALRTAVTGGGLSSNHVLQLTGGVLESSGTFNRTLGTSAGNFNFGGNDGIAVGGGFSAQGGNLAIQINGGTSSIALWGSLGNVNTLFDGLALMLNSTTADGVVDFQNGLNLGNTGRAARVIDVADNVNSTTDGARISGQIIGPAGTNESASALVKTGAGRLEITGSNTYVGGTVVAAGTLLVNNTAGSGLGTGSVRVRSGAVLGGTGFIAPTGANSLTVEDGGTIAPGASIGVLEINLGSTTGGVSMLGDSNFKFELGTAGGSIAAPGTSDLLRITGASAGDFVFSLTGNEIDFLGTGEVGWYKLYDTSLVAGTTWGNLTLSGQEIVGGLTAINLANGLMGTLFVGNGTGFGDFDDIYLQVQAVPEPSAAALLGLGAGLLAWRGRRNRKAAR